MSTTFSVISGGRVEIDGEEEEEDGGGVTDFRGEGVRGFAAACCARL
jgi:hypothetical protein